MGEVLPPIPSSEAFEPEATAAMAKAFDKLCLTISPTEHADVLREIIAKRIVELARQGSTDPEALCAQVLTSFGIPAKDEGTDS
jgi:hypothetical protein